jgi:PAS domain S-box-containing protein
MALVIILAGFALSRVEEKIKTDVGEALQIALQTTRESLNLWIEFNKSDLTRLAGDPRIVFLAEQQLLVPRNQDDLLKSPALRELRRFFQNNKDRFGQARYFIMAPDFINIASMGDKNIGSKNQIASQALDFLNKAFQGEAVMIPPIWADVDLASSSGNKASTLPTLFFVAPVKNIRGQIIAAVARKIDPLRDFTRLIQLGRIGETGETYAFNRYGKLLSQSRFDEDLRRAGLIKKGEKSILAVSMRDPGGDMTKGFSPSVPRYQQPLTLMASQATKGKSGLNVKGYRDYRGVVVYGAWLWDDSLGIGLATEIDQADALGSYFATRRVILTVLGVTVLLALGSMMFAGLIDVRANRALQKSHDELEYRVEERTAELKENQARLLQAEERSRLLLEFAEEGIFGVGEDGLVNFINPAGLAILGFETDELIGQKIHPLIHHTLPDGRPYPIEECPMHRSLTQGVIGSRDDEVLWRKDGTPFPVEYTSVPIRKNDSIVGTVVVFRDISERKEAEEALRKSRATARGLLDATQESLLLLDSKGVIIAVNQTAARRHQKKPEELIGKKRFDLIPQDLRESRKAHFSTVLQTGKPADFEDVRDGMVLHHIYYPVQDKTGVIIGVAIFAQDITERKRAEEAIRENQERLSNILKTTNQGFWLVDNDTVTLDVNDAMCEILDRTKEYIIGKEIYDFLDEENRAKVHKQEEMRSESKRSLYEVSLMRSDGTQVPCLVNASPLLDKDGCKIGSFGMFTDITERKQMEEELRRNVEELERFSKVAFGREKKMIQLKQKINELMIKLGQGEKYKIVK